MRTCLDCIPCFIRQALEAARIATDDKAIHEEIVRGALRQTAEMDLSRCPPELGQKLHRRLRQITGVADPYHEIKTRFNALALAMLPELQKMVVRSSDPWFTALRLAIAGNVIDLGVKGGIGEGEVRQALRNVLEEPFHGQVEELRRGIDEAQEILYLADNAGEIVLDRLLIDRIGKTRVTVAVRGEPVLNDATREDAVMSGLAGTVELIDNGSDAPGTILSDCSEEFRRRFKAADLIIAKGQGNFETLSDEAANIYFLFKVKCSVVASHVGLPMGTHVAIHQRSVHAAGGGAELQGEAAHFDLISSAAAGIAPAENR